jgi:uncharacterized protein YaeQ
MALTSTVHVFDVALSDVDRGVYTSLSLKVARHPSETEADLLTRVLAYALDDEDGIAFTQGLSVAEDPAVWVKDLTGQLRVWIEVGTPDAPRLHRASKACNRVVVYCHKDVGPWFRLLAGQKVYASERVEIVAIDPAFIEEVCARIERRTALAVSVTEGTVYLDIAGASFSTTLVRHTFPK